MRRIDFLISPKDIFQFQYQNCPALVNFPPNLPAFNRWNIKSEKIRETSDNVHVKGISLAICFSAEKFCWRIEISTYSNVSKWNQTFVESFHSLANDEQQSCRITGEKKIKRLQIYIVSDQLSDRSLFLDFVTFRSRNHRVC